MYRLLIDTNIWIDLAGNFKEQPLLLVLEGLVREKARLLVPSIVMKEFEAKREGTERAAAQRAASAFSSAKAVVELLGNSEDNRRIREVLADFGQKYPLVGEIPKFYVRRVQDLLAAGEQVEPSDSVKVRAATRAMERRAPSAKPNKEFSVSLTFEGDRSSKRIVGKAKRSHDGGSLDVYVAGEHSHGWTWSFMQEALDARK